VGLDFSEGEALDGRAAFFSVDITDELAVRQTAAAIKQNTGDVDAIIHAAAATGRSGWLVDHSLRNVELDLWHRILDANLTGALICARELGAILRKSSDGQILLLGSIAGLVPTIGSSAYAISKGALVTLTRQLAAEYAHERIRVNLVAPGPHADETEQAQLGASGCDLAPTPLGRYGDPSELGEAIARLVTHPFSFMTGACIPIDGGEHLRPRNEPVRSNPQDPVTTKNRASQ
jgi:NAD(P)-dependent dehydrogenase (short-subunit alcohol dehydrogenase family)